MTNIVNGHEHIVQRISRLMDKERDEMKRNQYRAMMREIEAKFNNRR